MVIRVPGYLHFIVEIFRGVVNIICMIYHVHVERVCVHQPPCRLERLSHRQSRPNRRILYDFILHALHSTLYTSHSTLPTLHSTLYPSPLTLPTLHSTLYTPHFTLHTPHLQFFLPLHPFTLLGLHSGSLAIFVLISEIYLMFSLITFVII